VERAAHALRRREVARRKGVSRAVGLTRGTHPGPPVALRARSHPLTASSSRLRRTPIGLLPAAPARRRHPVSAWRPSVSGLTPRRGQRGGGLGEPGPPGHGGTASSRGCGPRVHQPSPMVFGQRDHARHAVPPPHADAPLTQGRGVGPSHRRGDPPPPQGAYALVTRLGRSASAGPGARSGRRAQMAARQAAAGASLPPWGGRSPGHAAAGAWPVPYPPPPSGGARVP
jgi:hypothetical protein